MPNAATIETLEIEIKQKATGAITHLKSIAKALREVKSATSDNGLSSIATGINKINRACENFNGMERLVQLRDIFREIRTEAEGAAKAIGAMNDAIKTSPTSRMYRNLQGTLTRAQTAASETPASRAVSAAAESGGAAQKMPDSFQETAAETKNVAAATEELTERIERLRTANHNLRDDLAASRAANKELRLALRGIKFGAEEAETGFQKLLKTLKRLIIYRALRALIMGFTKALKEGLENMYQWSKLNNGEFAKSMDRLASCAAQLKNSLAVMIAPLIQMVVPIIELLTKVIVGLANAISMLLSFLQGAATWTKVNSDYMTEWKKSAGAAQRTILAFDEINKLNGKNGGGGDGVSGMFSEVPLAVTMSYEKYKSIIDKLMASIGLISDAYDDATDSSDKFGDAQLDLVAVLAEVVEALTKTKTTAERLREAQGDYFKEASSAFNENLLTVNGWVAGVTSALAGARQRMATFVFESIASLNNWGVRAKETLTTFAQTLSEKFAEAKSTVTGWVDSTAAAFSTWGTNVLTTINTVITTIPTILVDGLNSAKAAVVTWATETYNSFATWASSVGAKVSEGIADAVNSIAEAIDLAKENIANWATATWTTLTDWITTTTDNIQTWAQAFAERIGNGLKNAWQNFKDLMKALGKPVTTTFTLKGLGVAAAGLALSGMAMGGGKNSAGSKIYSPNAFAYASGGFPTIGDLFIANERGPELVGTINNRPAVANNQQIIEGVASGVAKAMAEQERLLREQNSILREKNNEQVVVSTGSLVSAFDRMNRRNGSTVIATGG